MQTKRVGQITAGDHRTRVIAARDALVLAHLSLPEDLARRIHARIPSTFELEDLIQTGTLALVRCASLYRPATHGGIPFEAYARLRVQGAILDSVRRVWSDGERTARDRHGWRPKVVSISPAAPHAAATAADGAITNALAGAIAVPDYASRIDRARLVRATLGALRGLSGGRRQVIEEYYAPGSPSFGAVGARMGLTRRAVGILHAEALAELRARLTDDPKDRVYSRQAA